jgi:hypothetical protein
MASKTVDDLKELRASLTQLRRKEAYLLSDDPEHGHREACASSSGHRSYGRGDRRRRRGTGGTRPASRNSLNNYWPSSSTRLRGAQDTVRQCRLNVGLGVPSTAIAPTTSSQNGSTPRPGIASRASPGNSSHCRPRTMNSSSAVPKSTSHPIGGKGVTKAPMASEMPAMAKARASRFLENLISALVGRLLGSMGMLGRGLS